MADVRELEDATGLRINAALIDCEGCIKHLWDTGLFERLEVVLIEEDGFWHVSRETFYPAVHERLQSLGFERIWRTRGLDHNEHHAWRRRGALPGAPSCEEYARRMKLNQSLLFCLPP